MKTFFSTIFLLVCLLSFGKTDTNYLNKLENAKSQKDSIRALLDISEHYRLKTPEKGLKTAKQALLLSNKAADTVLIIKSGYKLAMIQKENSLYSSALGTIINSINLATAINSDSLLADGNLVAGHIHANMGSYNKANESYKQALNYFLSKNDSSGISYTYSGLGIIFYDRGENESALKYYLNAEKYWADGESSLKADLWNNIGALYQAQRNFIKAEAYYNKALRFYEIEQWWADISMVNYNLGEMFIGKNELDNAIYHFNKSLDIGKRIKSPTEEMWAYYGLYLASKQGNKFEKALQYHEHYRNLNDSLEKAQNAKEVMELEALFNKEQQLKKIKNQQLTIANSEKNYIQEKNKNYIIVIVAAALASLLALFIYFATDGKKRNKELTQQKNIINQSLQEKELLLKEIHHRVKNNLQVISSLLNLQKGVVENENTNYVIDETQNRIRAIALVHQKLYQTKHIGQINFSTYLKELVDQQKYMYQSPEVVVDCKVNTPDFLNIDLDIAVSLGLIVTELITNSFKYAFKANQENVLTVELYECSNQGKLSISDNGPGVPTDILSGKKESLGIDLVNVLTEQINGELSAKNNNGAKFEVIFDL